MSAAAQRADRRPCGIVTLTTDFGYTDPYVGIMKGVMLSIAAEEFAGTRLELVDLTHGIAAQSVDAAAFHLEHAWRRFPRGTVHLAVVDPGVGTDRGVLVCALDGQLLIAPDNGLLSPILGAAGERAVCRELDLERHRGPELSRTFHGRDLFAPLAARLACGLDLDAVGPRVTRWVALERPRPVPGADGELAGCVQVVDGFGNLITNVAAADLDGPLERWTCELGASRIPLAETYGEGPSGALVALVDSFGYWEVAVCDGDAARRLAAGPGTPVVFRRKV